MTKQKIALITDSTCDIPGEWTQKYSIEVVPSYVLWGTDQFRDRVELSPQQFYERLAADPNYPSSSQPTQEDFLHRYREAAEAGAEAIVVITVSHAMSGTYDSALQAGNRINLPVHVIDSKGPSMSLGWQVLAAARAREAGGDVQAMIEAAAKTRLTMVQFVLMDTIDYLHKGGRIGNATRFLGSMLNVKPIVTINHQTGLVEAHKMVRTHRKALEVLYQDFFEHLLQHDDGIIHLAVMHGNTLSEAKALAKRIQQQFRPAELLIHCTGPVLGINTGPGALALCGYVER